MLLVAAILYSIGLLDVDSNIKSILNLFFKTMGSWRK